MIHLPGFMKISDELLIELNNNLPRGSAKRIQGRLKQKGIYFSLQYILRCINPSHSNYNHIIIESAIRLVEDDTVQLNKICQRIEDLKSNAS